MNKNLLKNTAPQAVWRRFEALCDIPHGSGNEQKLSDTIFFELTEKGFDCRQDTAKNIVVHLPASNGYEDHPAVILQGHLDMVCAVRDGAGIDMATTPLDLFLEGDDVGAKDTSLGGDDGIAVAMMLALCDDPFLPHPALDLIFTTDEEVGMSGALVLDTDDMRGRRMINLDSEEEGVFTVGCAGGVRVNTSLPVSREPVSGRCGEVRVTGLTGGHSGAEIHHGRANANITLGKLIKAIRAVSDCRFVEMAGGTKDNVIPSTALAGVVFPEEDIDKIKAVVAAFKENFDKEFAGIEPNAEILLTPAGNDTVSALTADDSDRLADLLAVSPYGVRKMSEDIEGLVQTSDNLGVIALKDTVAELHYSVRSSVRAERDALADELAALAVSFGGSAVFIAPYPAWEYRKCSPLRDVMSTVWRERTGTEPVVCTIHAGLECGLFGEKMPGLDAVSIGPDMKDIHSPHERLSISSVARTWDFLLAVLKAL